MYQQSSGRTITQRGVKAVHNHADHTDLAVCPFCGEVAVYPESTGDAVSNCYHFMGFVSGGGTQVVANFQGFSGDIGLANNTKRHAISQGNCDWTNFDFTEAEAKAMVRGYTQVEREAESGGVWYAGNAQFPQAISADHTRKLYYWNFKCDPGQVQMRRTVNGITEVVE